MSKDFPAVHKYRGGRYRPEVSRSTGRFPALKRDRIQRGVCRVCGKTKSRHKIETVEGLLG